MAKKCVNCNTRWELIGGVGLCKQCSEEVAASTEEILAVPTMDSFSVSSRLARRLFIKRPRRPSLPTGPSPDPSSGDTPCIAPPDASAGSGTMPSVATTLAKYASASVWIRFFSPPHSKFLLASEDPMPIRALTLPLCRLKHEIRSTV